MNDPLSNFFSAIQNAERVGKRSINVYPFNKLMKILLNHLQKEGFVKSFEELKNNRHSYLIINLKGAINECGVIKPRFSVGVGDFEKYEKRFLPSKNIGLLFISTPYGIMTHEEAKQKNIGGKLVAYCY
jgi:small subunit ribosomal protein S8